MAEPWLCPEATTFLDRIVTGARVFEFGMGDSTPWLAERAIQLVSVEHSRKWYDRTKEAVLSIGDSLSADWVLVLQEDLGRYPSVIHRHGWFDVIIVDGRERGLCIVSAQLHVVHGGWLVLDDSERSAYAWATKSLKGWDAIIKSGRKAGSKRGQIVSTQTTFYRRPE